MAESKIELTILAVGGSPRAGGNTDKLIAAALEGAAGLCPGGVSGISCM